MRSGMRLEDAGLQGPTRQLLPRSRSRRRKKPQVELASHRSSSSGPPRLRDPRRTPPKRLRRCGGYRWLSPHELVCWARSSCENTFSLLLPSRRVEGRVRYRPTNWSSRPRACPKRSPVGPSGVDRWSGILDAERQRSHSVSMAVHLVCARFWVRDWRLGGSRGEPVIASGSGPALLRGVPSAGRGAGKDRVKEGGGLGVCCPEVGWQPDVCCGTGVGACPRGWR